MPKVACRCLAVLFRRPGVLLDQQESPALPLLHRDVGSLRNLVQPSRNRCNSGRYILCGEEKTGRLVVYNRPALYAPRPTYDTLDLDDRGEAEPLAWSGPGSVESPDTVRPERRLAVHQEGASITSIHTQVLAFDYQVSSIFGI